MTSDPNPPPVADPVGPAEPAEPPEPAEALPPDPVAYDSERNAIARARGLAAPYIAGGRDPNPDDGRREERFYGRLLLIMIVAIVAGGFVLGVVANIIGAMGTR